MLLLPFFLLNSILYTSCKIFVQFIKKSFNFFCSFVTAMNLSYLIFSFKTSYTTVCKLSMNEDDYLHLSVPRMTRQLQTLTIQIATHLLG